MAEGNSNYEIVLTATDKTREAFEQVKESTGTLTDKLDIMRLAFSATAVASAVAVALMVKGAIESADAMNKSAQKVGTTTEMLSGLKYAADLSDVSFESLQKSLGKLSKNAFMAATQGGAAATAFATLGVNVKGTDGHLKDSGSLLQELADKFAAMPNSTEKTALAMQMFGKAGMDMIPLLNGGSEGLEKLRDEAEKLGVVISTDTAARAEEFNDNITRIKKSSEGLTNHIMADLLPAMGEVAQAFADSGKNGSALTEISGGIKTIFETITIVAAEVAFTFKGVGTEIGGIAAQVNALAHADFSGFKQIGKSMKDDAEQARKELDEFEQRILNPPKRKAEESNSTGAIPSLDTEAINKALEALLKKSQSFSDELVISHESAFDKIVTKYVAMDAELTKAGSAGNEQRKALAKAFEAFMVDESDKRTAKIAEDAEKEAAANSKILDAQQEKFTKMKEKADEASQFGEEREKARYAAQLRELEKDRQVLEDKHLSTLESEAKFNAAKEALEKEHQTRMAQTSKTYGMTLVQFEKSTAMQRTETMAAGLEQMTAVGAAKHRALFEINKIAGMANATIKGVEAVQSSYAFGAEWGGPVGGAAMAAIAIAATLANIEAISSTEFGGGAPNVGGGGVPSMSTSPGIPVAPQPAPAPPTQAVAAAESRQVNFHIPGGLSIVDLQQFTRDHIIPALNEAVGDGVVVNVV